MNFFVLRFLPWVPSFATFASAFASNNNRTQHRRPGETKIKSSPGKLTDPKCSMYGIIFTYQDLPTRANQSPKGW